ncbi:hypothetical protein ALI44B_01480 [Leifsonia sp. ALI-44-B]|jgi:hypothetical protein|uniref:protealysin inhibitor emfourin n=1 Tax=Leifsonia sp. ALI-44-B TaxID=1933776 RepID=UPI00097C25EB|nr:protealysin inhibitor emfourin [Leifsonia sp. ALI-44-B]ONI63426.1 hypothetical protein ALI44B_01480 [Leifsonia sp. ALI-44-B]
MSDIEPASTLRITVTRSGGVAGLSPRWTVEAEAEPDVAEWLALVDSCPWDDEDAGLETGADRFVYTIRVLMQPAEVGKDESSVDQANPTVPEERGARIPEKKLDGPWRELVDRVKDTSQR